MKIILTETLDRIGQAGSIINVKDGFARNYLIPKNYAILATEGNIKKIEGIKAVATEKHNALLAQFREIAEKINHVGQASFIKKAEESGHLFGSVSENDIVHFLSEKGINIHKNNVVMDKVIKTVGEYSVTINFMNDIKADLKVSVEKE
jgi:large subunit ribosomal protein L9